MHKITDEGGYVVNPKHEEKFYPANTVFLATGLKPRIELVESLRFSAPDFSVIGDSMEPDMVLEATHMGYFSALDI